MPEIVGEPKDLHESVDAPTAIHEEQPAPQGELPATGIAVAGEAAMPQWPSRVVDYVVAGCLCVAALGYWTSNSLTASSEQEPLNVSAVPVQPPPPPSIGSSQLSNEGAKLFYAGQYQAAEQLLRKAIVLDPNNPLVFCNLGADLIAERRYDEAIAMLRRSLELDPNLTLARNNLKWANEEKAKHAK